MKLYHVLKNKDTILGSITKHSWEDLSSHLNEKENPTWPLIASPSQLGTQPETWNISRSASANRMRQFLTQSNSCNYMRVTSASWLRQVSTSCQIDQLSLQFLTKFNRLNEHSLWLKFECITFMIAKWCQFLPTRPLILFLFLFLSPNTSNIRHSIMITYSKLNATVLLDRVFVRVCTKWTLTDSLSPDSLLSYISDSPWL